MTAHTHDIKSHRNSLITLGSPAYYKALIALFIGGMVCFGLEYCVQPIIPVLAEEFNLAPARASLSVTFGTGGMAIAMLAIAMYARRMPRRKVMMTALGGAIVLAIGIAFCEYFYAILPLRALQGVLLAGFPAMAVAYVNEEFDPTIIATSVGVYISGTSIGGLIGRLLLSALTDHMSWRYALLILCALYALLLIAFFWLLPKEQEERTFFKKSRALHSNNRENSIQEDLNLESRKPNTEGNVSAIDEDKGHNYKSVATKKGDRNLVDTMRLVWADTRVRWIIMIAMFIMGSFVCTYNFITYVLINEPYSWSRTTIGLIYLLYFLGAVSSTVMGIIADRYSQKAAFLISVCIMILGSLISTGEPVLFKIGGLGCFTLGHFGAHSTACSWAGKVGKVDKGIISSSYMFFFYVGGSVFGSMGGIFLSSYGWIGVVFFNICLLIGAIGCAWKVKK